MTFHDWQQLSPADAAREVLRRAHALPAEQQRAIFAELPAEDTLAARFASARAGAPLRGVPYLLKDLFPGRGSAMAAGSTFLPEVREPATADATIVTALAEAGAVPAGRTHLHEFAYGITGENPHYGDCEHPRFPGRTSGGSSSGSAAAVAAGVVPLTIGTDTGGSVRVPAAFCGLFGFRLRPQDKFIRDAFPLAPTFDTAGWFTRDAADMRSAIDALVGAPSSPRTPRGGYVELPGLDADVAAACRAAAEKLAEPVDAETRATLLRGFEPSLEAYHRIVAHEAWATQAAWAERFRESYDPAVWQRLQRGRTQPRADVDEAHVTLAAVRLLWAKVFLAYDFLVLPATPCGALTKAELTPANRTRLIALTAPASLGGLPVLTVPVSLPSGLTTGLQIVVPDPHSPAITRALSER